MVEFNQRSQPQAQDLSLPPGYVGYSQGVRQTEDNSAEIIGRGLAKAFGDLVAFADQQVKNDIGNTAAAEFDQTNKDFGLTPGTAANPVPGSTPGSVPRTEVLPSMPPGTDDGPGMPRSLTSQLESVRTLGSAADEASGSVRLSYEARLTNMVSGLRAKYPGYRPQIDQIVSQVTGQRPEIEYANERLKVIEAGDPGVERMQKLVDDMGKAGTLPPDYYQRLDSNPYGYLDLKAWQSDKTRQKFDNEARSSQMAADAAQDKLDHAKVVQNFAVDTNQFITTSLQDASTVLGKDYQELVKAAGDPNAKDWTPEYKEELKTKMREARVALDQAMQAKFRAQWGSSDDPTHNYAAQLTKDEYDNTVKLAMEPFDVMEKGFIDQDIGALKTTASYLEAQKDADKKALLEGAPTLRVFSAFKELAGPEVAAAYVKAFPEVDTAIADQVIKYKHLNNQTANPTSPDEVSSADQSMTDINKEKSMSAAEKKDYFQGEMKLWGNLVEGSKAGEIEPAQMAKDVQYYFGPKNWNLWAKMDDASRNTYFQKMTSPEVSRQMLALKNAGDEQSYNTYKQWTLNTFQALTKSNFEELANYNIDQKQLEIVYNPQANQLQLVKNPNFNPASPEATQTDPFFGLGGIPGKAYWAIAGAFTADIQKSLDKINASITNVVPIIQSDKQNVPLSLARLLDKNHIGPPPAISNDVDTAASATAEDAGYLSLQKAARAAMKGEEAPPDDDPGYWEKNLPFVPQFQQRGETQGSTESAQPVNYTELDTTDQQRFAQYAFVTHEMNTTERGAGDALRTANTPADAARIVSVRYERPSLPNMRARIANANTVYNGGGGPRAQAAYAEFQRHGWTREQAAGIVGNLIQESRLSPGIVGDAGASHGVGQWNGGRLRAMRRFTNNYQGEGPAAAARKPEQEIADVQTAISLAQEGKLDMTHFSGLSLASKLDVLHGMVNDEQFPTGNLPLGEHFTTNVPKADVAPAAPEKVTRSITPQAATPVAEAPQKAASEASNKADIPKLAAEAGLPPDKKGAGDWFRGLDMKKGKALFDVIKKSGLTATEVLQKLNPEQKAALEEYAEEKGLTLKGVGMMLDKVFGPKK